MSSTAVIDSIAPLFIVDTFTDTIEDAIETVIETLPSIILLLVVLGIGVYLGGLAKPFVVRLLERVDLDERFRGSALGSYFDEEASISNAIGILAKWYIILVALLVAVELAGFEEFLEEVEFLVWYVPELLVGILIILVGLILAEHAARQTRGAPVAEESRYGSWLVAGVKGTIIFIAFVIGLEMIGVDLTIVYLIVEGIVSAIGLGVVVAIALAIGLAAGFFAKDYVEWQSDSGTGDE